MDHSLGTAIKLDWKIMIHAPHYYIQSNKWKCMRRNYISHTNHSLEALVELDWKICMPHYYV